MQVRLEPSPSATTAPNHPRRSIRADAANATGPLSQSPSAARFLRLVTAMPFPPWPALGFLICKDPGRSLPCLVQGLYYPVLGKAPQNIQRGESADSHRSGNDELLVVIPPKLERYRSGNTIPVSAEIYLGFDGKFIAKLRY